MHTYNTYTYNIASILIVIFTIYLSHGHRERTFNSVRLNNTLLNNQLVKEKIKREIKIYLESNKDGNATY